MFSYDLAKQIQEKTNGKAAFNNKFLVQAILNQEKK